MQHPADDIGQQQHHYHLYNAAAPPLQPQQPPGAAAAHHHDYYPPAAAAASDVAAALRPPGIEPYVPNPYNNNNYSIQTGYAPSSSSSSSSYYVYPNVAGPSSSYYHAVATAGDSQGGFAVMEAIRQYGVDPLAQVDGLGRPPNRGNPPYLANQVARPFYNGATKIIKKKSAKVVQSAFCDVCKIECNSQDVLKNHKQGKKHKKNLEKLKESIAPKPIVAPPATVKKVDDGSQKVEKEKTTREQSKKRSTPATEVDLETKRKRVLEGGAAAEAVRVCTICNVVCNSQLVFAFHIAGQKHASMVKKQQESKSS